MKNKYGPDRFDRQFKILESYYNKPVENNRAIDLYRHGARRPLFMLEALARIYYKITESEVFRKQLDYYKNLEDLLGQIDHYEGLLKSTSNAIHTGYFLLKRKQAEADLNRELHSGEKFKGLQKLKRFKKQLQSYKWPSEQKETAAVENLFRKEFRKIREKIISGELGYGDVEQVHELRRKLRWLSIYSEALDGMVVLGGSKKKAFAKYRTKAIQGSAFSKLPKHKKPLSKIYFDHDHFFALCWIV
ncbi:MAG: hypothetical protein M3R27_08775, partial [Bacteroidota bacterium]|nr:hypothetical protein [Bacteroidota bacterium]